MTTVWASRHEDLVSHDGVSSHVCDPMVVPHGWAVLDRGNPSGSAGDACRDAAAQARRAARAVDSGVMSVPQAHIPPNLVVRRCRRTLITSRREDLQVEHPVRGRDATALHFHSTLARVQGPALIRDQVVQVR